MEQPTSSKQKKRLFVPQKENTEMNTIGKLEQELYTAQESLAESQKLIASLKEQIEKEKEKPWTPISCGYYAFGDGSISTGGDGVGQAYFEQGRIFSTKDQAIKANKAFKFYQLLYQLALDLNEGWEPDWSSGSEVKIEIYYNKKDKRFDTVRAFHCKTFGVVYFKDYTTANKAIKIIESGALGEF